MLRQTFIILSVLSTLAAAESIRLKNGRTILADSVRETNGKIEYSIGDNTFAIAKSSVERIDTGGSPVVTHHEEMPASAAGYDDALHTSDEVAALVVHDGRVDPEGLARIERQGNSSQTAVAYFFVAQHERNRNNLAAAERYLQTARSHLPDNATLMGHHASVLAEMNRYTEAAAIAQQAIDKEPDSAPGYTILGFVFYQQGKMKEAVRALKRSLELSPDNDVRELLKKVERETNAEGEFNEQSSNHFTLHYEGGQAPLLLRRQMLDVLEQHYDELVRDFDYAPRENIQVLLYRDKQFFDVTKAPAWTGAINDGKLRIPISGLENVDTNLSRVLKHELSHSFINLITQRRAPTWLHEGLAQLEEPATASRDGNRLAGLYAAGANIPLNQLEAPFIRFSAREAQVAYAQSLASVEYMRDQYGLSSVADLMKRMGEGQSTESALRGAIHSGYAQFERELAEYLKKTYQ